MYTNKQLFLFDATTHDVINKVARHHVCFFSKTTDGTVLTCNDHQAEFFGRSIDCFIGTNSYELDPNKDTIKLVKSHDTTTINSNEPQLFYETALNKPCICIKTKVFDSSSNLVGIGGFAFYFHQISLKDIISIINKFIHLNTFEDQFCKQHISHNPRFNQLSEREQECASYLTKSYTYKEMATAMNISKRTVEKYINRIKYKLGSYSRSDIVSKVFE